MGSLMAGWGSPSVKFERNKSLTKEEIDAFWRLKKQKEEEHLREISSLSPRDQTTQKIQFGEEADDNETNLEKLIQTHGWWISSNWAHLNEPPLSGPERVYKYMSQFHVASMATSDTNPRTGISA